MHKRSYDSRCQLGKACDAGGRVQRFGVIADKQVPRDRPAGCRAGPARSIMTIVRGGAQIGIGSSSVLATKCRLCQPSHHPGLAEGG